MRFRPIFLTIAVAASSFPSIARAQDPAEFPRVAEQPMMVISKITVMMPNDAKRIIGAARATGASAFRVNFPSVPLTAHSRDDTDLLRLKSGWRIALATMVVDQEFIRVMGGEAMAESMGVGKVLMGESGARVRKAKVGDVLTLRGLKFGPHTVVVGGIVADSFIDWGDIAMSPQTARFLGPLAISNVTIVNISSPPEVRRALISRGITKAAQFRTTSSWDNPNPDKQLGTGVTKTLLGEFSFRPTTGGSMIVSSAFLAENIVWGYRYKDIPLVNNCHREVIPAIQGALTAIKKAGLAKFIDVQNSNSMGGCFVGRYNRLARKYGSPSRHAWGMAFDINTNTNQQGATPQLKCGIVRIFRQWGFAWGGGFYPADGMHFEYVGEPRNELGYRSHFCSNDVPIPTTTLPSFAGTALPLNS